MIHAPLRAPNAMRHAGSSAWKYSSGWKKVRTHSALSTRSASRNRKTLYAVRAAWARRQARSRSTMLSLRALAPMLLALALRLLTLALRLLVPALRLGLWWALRRGLCGLRGLRCFLRSGVVGAESGSTLVEASEVGVDGPVAELMGAAADGDAGWWGCASGGDCDGMGSGEGRSGVAGSADDVARAAGARFQVWLTRADPSKRQGFPRRAEADHSMSAAQLNFSLCNDIASMTLRQSNSYLLVIRRFETIPGTAATRLDTVANAHSAKICFP